MPILLNWTLSLWVQKTLLVFTLTVVTLKCNAEAFSKEERLPLNHLTPPPPPPPPPHHVLTGGMHTDSSLIQHLNDCDLSHLHLTAARTSHHQHTFWKSSLESTSLLLYCYALVCEENKATTEFFMQSTVNCGVLIGWSVQVIGSPDSSTQLYCRSGKIHVAAANTTKCETAHILNII